MPSLIGKAFIAFSPSRPKKGPPLFNQARRAAASLIAISIEMFNDQQRKGPSPVFVCGCAYMFVCVCVHEQWCEPLLCLSTKLDHERLFMHT